MSYYCMSAQSEDRVCLGIVAPWGMCACVKSPQGLKIDGDMLQRKMMNLLSELVLAKTFIDEILAAGRVSFEERMKDVEIGLSKWKK